jgi:glucokinase
MIGAIDIGGTKIAVGAVDASGRVLAQRKCPTQAERGLAEGLERMRAMLRQVVAGAGGSLEGIGIGCTGRMDAKTGRLSKNDFLPGWEGADLALELSRAFGVSAAIENDANAAALGEWAWGAGAGKHRFLLVTVGTGIGVGLVLDGQLYRGVDGSHPEIGHHVIDPSGPPCFCGARGCWESLASGAALERWAQSNHPEGRWLSARQLFDLAEGGDSLSQAAVQHTGQYLALGLANLVTLFSPEMIALGGGLLQDLHHFWPIIEGTVRANCGLVPSQRVQIVPARFGAQAGLVGAAQVWYNRYHINSPRR